MILCIKALCNSPDRHPGTDLVQISKKYTHYGATALFFFFGLRMLYEAVTGAASAAGESELEEVEKELQVRGCLKIE